MLELVYLFIYLMVCLKRMSTSGYERIYPRFWEICCFPEDGVSSFLHETRDSLQDHRMLPSKTQVSLQPLENSNLLNFTNY